MNVLVFKSGLHIEWPEDCKFSSTKKVLRILSEKKEEERFNEIIFEIKTIINY